MQLFLAARVVVVGSILVDRTLHIQVVQRKVDLPLYDDATCNAELKAALNNQRRGAGDRFSLSRSEICAGGEVGNIQS